MTQQNNMSNQTGRINHALEQTPTVNIKMWRYEVKRLNRPHKSAQHHTFIIHLTSFIIRSKWRVRYLWKSYSTSFHCRLILHLNFSAPRYINDANVQLCDALASSLFGSKWCRQRARGVRAPNSVTAQQAMSLFRR